MSPYTGISDVGMVGSSDSPVRDSGYNPDTGHYQTWFEQYDEIPSEVIRAVAAIVGSEPTALLPLYDTVNPESLVAMLRPSTDAAAQTELAVSFTFNRCRVTVTRGGLVDVAPPESDTDADAS